MPVDRDRNRLVVRRISRLAGKLDSSPRPEDVHKFRTNVRRLEAMLPLLAEESESDHKKLLKSLGRLRRRVGKVRDLDVQLTTLRSLKLPEEAEGKAYLQRLLNDLRARREKKLARKTDKEGLKKLRKRLRKLEGALIFPETFDPVRFALQQFSELTRQHGPLNDERLHRYRIAAKRVRYIAEMAGKDPETQRLVSELKSLQTALGEWHDWMTLTATAEESLKQSVNNPLVSALRSITRDKFREAVQMVNETRRSLLPRPAPVQTATSHAVRRPTSTSRRPSRADDSLPAKAVA